MRPGPGGWNHNSLYHRVILTAAPAGCERALDVGCGEGDLSRQLRSVVPTVVGIDRDAPSLALARAHPDAGDIRYIEGDALTHPFESGSFDLVTAVASLHHMDADVALTRLVELLRPGGVLAVVGLARSGPADLVLDVAAVVPNRVRRRRAPYRGQASPTVWPPPETYTSMRRLVRRRLPGAEFRRRLYWRYTLVWVKPLP